jgi:hypothetical protein
LPFRVLKVSGKIIVASMRCEKTDAANRGAFVCLVLELACTYDPTKLQLVRDIAQVCIT